MPARRRRRWLWGVLGVLLGIALLLGAAAAYMLHMDLPDVQALEDYQPPTITRILAADGRPVHQYAEQKRIVVPLSAISDKIQSAVMAVEDANFLKHVGVDPMAIARALIRDIQTGRWEEGGSTLTQQLTKILFLTPEKTIRRKIQEAMLAMQIEKTYTKEEILEFYLNQINMGHGRYGMEAAAQFYFGKSASDVTLEEAALLAAIVNRPMTYSPFRNAKLGLQRRNRVLDRMLDEGMISAEEAARAKETPIAVAQAPADKSVAPYFAEEIRKVLAPRYGEEILLREGLSIQTGMDLDLQEAANGALSKGLRALDKRRGFRRPEHNIVIDRLGTIDSYQHPGWDRAPQPGQLVTGLVTHVSAGKATVRVGSFVTQIHPADAAWTGRSDLSRLLRPGDLALFEVKSAGASGLSLALDQEPEVEGAVIALDPRSGDIRAMVGGWDFNRSQFNRTFQAQRQCGSAFKPFIYAAAIEQGHTPSDLLFDEPTVFVDGTTGAAYQPENYERHYEGVVTLRKALEQSINVPTVLLLNRIGYQNTVEFARRLGITSKLNAYPSLALGSSEVSLMELSAAYGVFATGGILSTPRYFSRIEDRNGETLEEVDAQSSEVLRADVAAVMVSIMQGVVLRGTAAAADRPGQALAGKTGTTDDYTDAWFIGYSPTLVVGVWVGHDKKLTLGPRETGARAALPIWSEVMDAWIARHPGEQFPTSSQVTTLAVDRDTGLRVTPEAGCTRVITETFIKGTEIERPCTDNAHARLRLPYFLQRYRLLSGGRVEVPDSELDRLLRENPFHLELVGRSNLNVATPTGVALVRLARGSGQGADLAWGFFRRAEASAPADEADEELLYRQLLPPDMPPLGTGETRFVGLDGRTAAVVKIQYP